MHPVDEFCKYFEQFHKSPSENLRKFYTKDVEFIDPMNHLRGLAEINAYFTKFNEKVAACTFDIFSVDKCLNKEHDSYYISWTINLSLRSDPTKLIQSDGVTHLKVNKTGIFYHRDYFDVGQLVYENIPLLKWIIKAIKTRLRDT
ncbi:nuclear transport factor 2 family protein [Alteromonas ponticola]|uniref:Nuclear transport factor 2 family protein n=1 Tax=Alteromonas aquimaris TaxID=2998417 RepID=A0ABT3P3S3_9ALTE|nr:nuclear transport factor 2 family protein [Alteromonas aquimaris]MCW8107420.1 nuclear transport factor 2 family protein [Alteromonas aquimaris]